jgi:hypothetical protein
VVQISDPWGPWHPIWSRDSVALVIALDMSNSGRRLAVRRQSHSLAEAVVYDDVILNAVRNTPPAEKMTPVDLPVEYYKAAGGQARKRVLAAGLRLGALQKNVNQ